MPTCRKCHLEKDVFSFPFIDKKRCYDNTCKQCRKISRRNCESEKIRRTWDALAPETNAWKKQRSKL